MRIHGTFDDESLARIGVSKEDVKVYFEYITSSGDEDDTSWGLATFSEGEYRGKTLEDVLRQVENN